MPESVRESIRQNIITTLRNITTGNGYQNNLASSQVQAWNPNGNSKNTVPLLVVNIGPDENLQEKNILVTIKMPVWIDVYTRHSEGAANDADKVLNDLIWDIKKALQADHTRGGFAVDTTSPEAIPFETVEGEPHIGIQMSFEVHYRHLNNDPAAAG